MEWGITSHILKNKPDGFTKATQAIVNAIIENGIPYSAIPNVFNVAKMIIDEETRPVHREITSHQTPGSMERIANSLADAIHAELTKPQEGLE